MTLRRKLRLTFVTILVLVAVQGLVAVVLLTQVSGASAEMLRPALARIDTLAHLEANVLRMHMLVHSLLQDGFFQPSVTSGIENLEASIDSEFAEYLGQLLDGTRARLGNAANERYVNLKLALEEQRASDSDFIQLDNQIHQLRHLEYAEMERVRDELVTVAQMARWPLLVVIVVIAAGELALGWTLSRGIMRSLSLLGDAAGRIACEVWDQPVPELPEPEFADLGATMNAVMLELKASRAERDRLEAERLQLVRDQLGHVVRAQEEERARVSRELHDQAGQALTALKYGLNHLAQQCHDPGTRTEVTQLVDLAGVASKQIGALARDLRPAVLDDLGLLAALRGYCREYSERVGIRVEVAASGPIPRLGAEAETAVYRVVQEALTNVAKHAHATHVWVDLASGPERLEVRVRDDGQGFDPHRLSSMRNLGLGLAGIGERVQLLGGELEIHSRRGDGTMILVSIPVAPSSAATREPLAVR